MFRFLVFVFILLTGCSSGDRNDNSKKMIDFNEKEARVLLSSEIKDKGIIKLNELKNGSQIVSFVKDGKVMTVNMEFKKDIIIHSLAFINELKLIGFSTLEGDKRGAYFWNPEEKNLYSYHVNDKDKTVEKSENLTKNPDLLKYVSGLNDMKPVERSENPPKIEYSLENEETVFQPNIVVASVSGKKSVIPDKKERCILISGSDDYDGDGDLDLLVEDVVACGGNCCPNAYYTISYTGDGKFKISENFNSSWEGIEVEKWKGRPSFVATSVNSGSNTEDYYEVKKRHIMINGEIKLVEFIESKEMDAVFNIRSKEFDMNKPEEKKVYEYDLDGDGKKETFSCKLWTRWGTVMCTIKKDNKIIAKDINGKRIGVLDSITNGLRDIVVNHYNVYKWDGKEYREVK